MYEEVLQSTIHKIETHLLEPLCTEALCQENGFSSFHFHRIFKSHVGMSMTAYIRCRRLTHAAVQLIKTDDRLLDLAFLYRFESQEAFTRAFKKQYGLPPGRYRTQMRQLTEEEIEMSKQTIGWMLSGVDPQLYEIGVDLKEVYEGQASGYIRALPDVTNENFGTMMQQFKATRWLGKRVRLSGFVKTEGVNRFAGLWMRIDDAHGDVLQFDNMSNRPIQGTTNWNRYSIVLDVPEQSDVISFGILLTGGGQAWLDQLTFMEVDKRFSVTNLKTISELPEEPVNLRFENQI